MNSLCRISFNRAWPLVCEASKVLIQKHATVRKILELRTCCYCKKYGLYDEEEDSFGEFNRRGAYIDHRSDKVGAQRRRNYANDYDDDMDDDEERNDAFSSRYNSAPRNQMQRPNPFQQRSFGSNRTPWRDGYERNDRYERNDGYERSGRYNERNVGYERNGRYNERNDRYNRNPYQSHQQSASKKPNFDHLPPVEKDFYTEHSDVAARSMEEIEEYRKTFDMSVRGTNIPKPISKFSELCVPDSLMQTIQEHDFSNPTPIQCQGWPIALRGRDMIGISQTGSGKTLVFTLPAMVHIMNQPKPNAPTFECAPQVLVLAPTRELAQQIHAVSSKFRHSCGIRSACIYGGASKGLQYAKMKDVQMCIATPGRLIDFLSEGSVNLNACTYLVLDEADRMLDMGFEPQIREIINYIRPDRQTLMWSATWPKDVQTLAEDFLDNYIQVTIGSQDLTANPNIKQNIYVVGDFEKHEKLMSLLKTIKMQDNSKTLVFAQTKRTVDVLAHKLNHCGILAMAIHGDVSQVRRDRVLNTFRHQQSAILIATDVAARGLDVNDIQHVINFDLPTNIEDYIHRIGRTARGSKSGTAHSFFTLKDANLTRDLINVLEKVGQTPSPELLSLVRSSGQSKKSFYGGRHYQQRYNDY